MFFFYNNANVNEIFLPMISSLRQNINNINNISRRLPSYRIRCLICREKIISSIKMITHRCQRIFFQLSVEPSIGCRSHTRL